MNSYRLVQASAQKIIVRPQNHWKSDYTVWIVFQEQVYSTKISDIDKLKRRINNKWAALNHVAIERMVSASYTLAFVLKADILSMCCKMIRCTTRLTIFGRQNCQCVRRCSKSHSFVHVVIIVITAQSWHLEFLKVVQAHILCEVGNLCAKNKLTLFSETSYTYTGWPKMARFCTPYNFVKYWPILKLFHYQNQ